MTSFSSSSAQNGGLSSSTVGYDAEYWFGFEGKNQIMPGVLSFAKENGKIHFHSRSYFGPNIITATCGILLIYFRRE
jgi:hypothetical protein